MNEIKDNNLSFHNLYYNLGKYPNNEVKVYSSNGMLLMNKSRTKNNFPEHIQEQLEKGMYIVNIIPDENGIPVSGKVMVQ